MSDPDESADRPASAREVLADREYLRGLQRQRPVVVRRQRRAGRRHRTGLPCAPSSPIASAAAFAISYLPWLGIGARAVRDHRAPLVPQDHDLCRTWSGWLMIALAVFGGLPVGAPDRAAVRQRAAEPAVRQRPLGPAATDPAGRALCHRADPAAHGRPVRPDRRLRGRRRADRRRRPVRAAAQRRHLRRLRAAGGGAGEGAHARASPPTSAAT